MAGVTLFDKNNNQIVADGITLFKFKENNKKYLFYTLNETVDADKIKMYVANIVEDENEDNYIDDDTWLKLKNFMIAIAHKDNIESQAEFERIIGKEIHLGKSDPRKIAIKFDKKQAFEENQVYQETLIVDKSEEPIKKEHQSFFNEEVALGTKVEEETKEESAFDGGLNAFSAKPIYPNENEFKIVEPTSTPQEPQVENMTGTEVVTMISNLTDDLISSNIVGKMENGNKEEISKIFDDLINKVKNIKESVLGE